MEEGEKILFMYTAIPVECSSRWWEEFKFFFLDLENIFDLRWILNIQDRSPVFLVSHRMIF